MAVTVLVSNNSQNSEAMNNHWWLMTNSMLLLKYGVIETRSNDSACCEHCLWWDIGLACVFSSWAAIFIPPLEMGVFVYAWI